MLVQLSQPSRFRWYLRNKEQSFERHIQPQLDSGPQLASLVQEHLVEHPSARALVIVLESKVLLIDDHQLVFEESSENSNEIQMVNQFSNDISHHLYLQDHLDSEWRVCYIISMLCQILDFLHV